MLRMEICKCADVKLEIAETKSEDINKIIAYSMLQFTQSGHGFKTTKTKNEFPQAKL
jgi:hypothetical protein